MNESKKALQTKNTIYEIVSGADLSHKIFIEYIEIYIHGEKKIIRKIVDFEVMYELGSQVHQKLERSKVIKKTKESDNKQKSDKIILSKEDCLLELVAILHHYIQAKPIANSANVGQKGQLKDIFDKEEVNKIESAIVDYFCSFPKEYIANFNLPNVVCTNPALEEIKINNLITLKFNKFDDRSEVQSFAGMLRDALGDKLSGRSYIPNSLCICIEHQGYLSEYNYTGVYAIFKQIVYLAKCLGLLKISRLPKNIAFYNPDNYKKRSLCNFVSPEDKRPNNIYLPDNATDFLSRLEMSAPDVLDFSQLKNFFDLVNNNKISNDNKKTYGDRIKSALEWGFESDIAENETFQFVLKTVAMEALLGDDVDDSKGEKPNVYNTLVNRLAYLIAIDHEDRKNIMDEFKKIYDTRSRLIHGSSSYLNSADKGRLHCISVFLNKAIQKELKMLSK